MYLYRDRQPLFLFGENEAATKKFVSTTLRPSLVNHDELYSWKGCAEFVSDAILPKMLESPTELQQKWPQNIKAKTVLLDLGQNDQEIIFYKIIFEIKGT